MATETLAPDGSVFALTNLTGASTDVNEPVDSPDGVWLPLGNDADDCIVRASFPTPTGDPNTGAGLQKFRVYVRVGTEAGGNTPDMDIAVRETGGGADLAVQTGISVTSYTGEVIEFTWDASVLGTVDGSAVEIYVIGNRSGGGPTSRRCVEFDAIEWVVDYAVVSSPQSIAANTASEIESSISIPSIPGVISSSVLVAAEAETTTPVTVLSPTSVIANVVAEVEAAFAVGMVPGATPVFANPTAEVETAITVAPQGTVIIAASAVSEVESALGVLIDTTSSAAVVTASETESALLVSIDVTQLVGIALETETAAVVVIAGAIPVGVASETETAIAVDHSGGGPTGQQLQSWGRIPIGV